MTDAPDATALERVARLHLALRALVSEHSLSAISVKCVEGVSVCMGCTPCLPATLLGDECPYVCENDIPGMLGHALLHVLTEQPSTFVESYEFFADRVLFGVCGFVPPSMIEGPRQAKVIHTGLFEGLIACSAMRPGRVTLCRPFWRQGQPWMHIVAGEAVAARPWVEIGYELPAHPSLEVIVDGGMEHFLQHVPAQHYSLVYGDHMDTLLEFCRMAGVEAVLAQ